MPDELRKLAGWLLESEWPTVSCPNCGLGFVGPSNPLSSSKRHQSVRWRASVLHDVVDAIELSAEVERSSAGAP